MAPALGAAVNPNYKLYHPRWHRRRFPIFWWLEKLSYTRFILRELTSLAVLYAAVLLVAQIWALGRGAETYARFRALLSTPAAAVLNTAVLGGLLYHTLTWLHLAPKAMVVRIGHRKVPDAVVLLGHYLAWLGATLLLVWGLGRA